MPASADPAIVVLDTNVVLDWLLFNDPRAAALAEAIRSGALRWIITDAMRDELAHVLSRGLAAARGATVESLLSSCDRYATQVQADPPRVVARLRCTDPDDQMFIDLAVQSGARWLVSRDKAVLQLARAAAPFGVEVLAPQRWQAS